MTITQIDKGELLVQQLRYFLRASERVPPLKSQFELLLHFHSASLLKYLEEQQKMAQVFRLLPPTWEPGESSWLLVLTWPGPNLAIVTTQGVNQRMKDYSIYSHPFSLSLFPSLLPSTFLTAPIILCFTQNNSKNKTTKSDPHPMSEWLGPSPDSILDSSFLLMSIPGSSRNNSS